MYTNPLNISKYHKSNDITEISKLSPHYKTQPKLVKKDQTSKT